MTHSARLDVPQRLTDIVLSAATLKDGAPLDLISAVQRFAWEMNRRSVPDAALPIVVVQSSFVEYYVREVQNGDIGQFVTNSRWTPRVVAGVRAGLAAMGAKAQAALFEDVVRVVEGTRPGLLAALESPEPEGPDAVRQPDGSRFQVMPQVVIGKYEGEPFGEIIAGAMNGRAVGGSLGPRERYRKLLDGIRGGFFRAFTAHPDGYEAGCEQIRVANAAWIRTWPGLKVVDEAAYPSELDRLAAAALGSKLLVPMLPVSPAAAGAAGAPQTGGAAAAARAGASPSAKGGWIGPDGWIGPLLYAVLIGLAGLSFVPQLWWSVPSYILKYSYPALIALAIAIMLSAANTIYNLAAVAMAALWRIAIAKFSIGFGTTLLGYRAGETMIRLGTLPLGGYVQFADAEVVRLLREGKRTFDDAPPWQRIAIAAAGPLSMVLLAWLATDLSPPAQLSLVWTQYLEFLRGAFVTRPPVLQGIHNLLAQAPIEFFTRLCMWLGVLNLLPLPLLNGGFIVGELIVLARGRRATARTSENMAKLGLLLMLVLLLIAALAVIGDLGQLSRTRAGRAW